MSPSGASFAQRKNISDFEERRKSFDAINEVLKRFISCSIYIHAKMA